MSDYAWDVLEYTDFSSSERPEVGKPFPGFGNELRVVAVTPPIHEGKDATVVLAFGDLPMPELASLLRRRAVSLDEIREGLARSSHETYEHHYLADSTKDPAKMARDLHEHDYDRADAAIAVLEELGVWTDPSGG